MTVSATIAEEKNNVDIQLTADEDKEYWSLGLSFAF